MKSISIKLFLVLLALTSLVLFATLLLARWSFDEGFVNYKKAKEITRLNLIAKDLSEDYIENKYKWPDDIDTRFSRIYMKWHPALKHRKKHPPRHHKRPPKPRRGELNNHLDKTTKKEHRLADRPKHHRPPSPEHSNFGPLEGRPPHPTPNGHLPGGPNPHKLPTALFDINDKFLAGDIDLPAGNKINVPILVTNQKVGILKTVARVPDNQSLEFNFYAEQTRMSALIALGCLLLAALASFFLARMLLSPILYIKKSVAHLASGNYTNRMQINRNDELGVLMHDIDNLANTLEENQHSRRRWLADISHELRTPVTVLSGEIEAINDGLRSLDTNQLNSFSHEVDHLKHLINDLYELSLSDIGGLRYEFKTLDMNELIQNIVQSNSVRLSTTGLSVQYLSSDKPIYVKGDTTRLGQLINNLLNNSLVYTDKPGRLTIEIKQLNDQLNLSFSDTAPTVENDKLESLFEPLYQEDKSRTRRQAGAGLGLTICRNIVHAHHGTINAKPSPEGGLLINIVIPITDSKP